MLAYRTTSYDVQLNVNNVFDREYIVSGHGSSKLLNLPGAPRNFRVTARYRF
jgi:catecholate siderophore receptor